MRIISGKHRGRILRSLDGENTRPTTDRVKKSLFDIIQARIQNSDVLDLFAGSGALGIECLSRGANSVVFCDNNKEAVDVINRNLKNIEGNYKIVHSDFKMVLKGDEKYDIIFIDAPYRSPHATDALNIINAYRILKDDGVICYERLFDLTPKIPDGLKIVDTRKYGKTALEFITYDEESSNNG